MTTIGDNTAPDQMVPRELISRAGFGDDSVGGTGP